MAEFGGIHFGAGGEIALTEICEKLAGAEERNGLPIFTVSVETLLLFAHGLISRNGAGAMRVGHSLIPGKRGAASRVNLAGPAEMLCRRYGAREGSRQMRGESGDDERMPLL